MRLIRSIVSIWYSIILFQAYLRINCYKVKKAYWLAKSVCEKSGSRLSHLLRIITMPTNRVAKVMFSVMSVCHCLSISVQGSSPASPTYRGPWLHPGHVQSCSTWPSLYMVPAQPPQTVGIRLKYLLVKSKIRHLVIVGRYIPVTSCKIENPFNKGYRKENLCDLWKYKCWRNSYSQKHQQVITIIHLGSIASHLV